eukprot:5017679-Amphidinium_carterae.1
MSKSQCAPDDRAQGVGRGPAERPSASFSQVEEGKVLLLGVYLRLRFELAILLWIKVSPSGL